jgi:SEL1 protein
MYGVGVPRSCAAAVLYYTPAAEAALAPGAAGGPPGNPAPIEKVRLTVEYATGAAARARERDMVSYYRYSADQGNADAGAAMGQLLASGGRGVARDYAAAARYLTTAAARGDADAAAALGRLRAHGLGIARDDAAAAALFAAAAEKGHPAGQYGLGAAHLAGAGVPPDPRAALQWLAAAAEQGSADAHAALGVLHARGAAGAQRDPSKAFLHLNTAAHSGHLLATYNLARMQLAGLGLPASCRGALGLLKTVAERGDAARVLEQAHAAHASGDANGALRLYLRGAHMGIEVAQANAAFLLGKHAAAAGGDGGDGEEEQAANGTAAAAVVVAPAAEGEAVTESGEAGAAEAVAAAPAPPQHPPRAASPSLPGASGRGGAARAALSWHSRSAAQGHVPSLVAVGDAHFYGRGTRADAAAAAAAYAAAGQLRSSRALFNLGVMHAQGTGLPRDLHLAKRYFDLSRDASPEARIPCALALAALRAHGAWAARRGALGGAAAAARRAAGDAESALLAVLCAALAGVLGTLRARRERGGAGGGAAAGGVARPDGDAASSEGSGSGGDGAEEEEREGAEAAWSPPQWRAEQQAGGEASSDAADAPAAAAAS